MVSTLAQIPCLLATPSVFQRALAAAKDTTFSDIHQLAWFDWALLIPYFATLIILSFYGLHRYEMIRGYMKHRRRMAQNPAPRFQQLPPVTIQLPL